MKAMFTTLLTILSLAANAQSIELRGGRNLMPGYYYALRYDHNTGAMVHPSLNLFLAGTQAKHLSYSATGLDLLAAYSNGNANEDTHMLIVRLAAGGTAQYENEPNIYSGLNFKQKLNYGIAAEAGAEWALSEQFSLTGYINQKWLFNKNLGSTFFVFGIGLKFQIN